MPLTAICMTMLFSQQCASADGRDTTYSSTMGRFDSGVIDSTNLMEFKEYEFRASEERKERHKDGNDIQMNSDLKKKVDNLPNRESNFVLNSVTFKGYTVFTEEELMNIICDKIGERVTVSDLVGMTNEVTEFYQKHGYISSVAYLAPQRVQDGNIVINILEGRYGNVTVDTVKEKKNKTTGEKELVSTKHYWNRTSYLNNHYLKDKYIEEGALLNVNDIRESLKDINSSGYMTASVALEENEESAEYTDLTLTVKDRFPIDFDLRWDDMGSTQTGLNRAILFAGLYNVTGFGDTLYSTTTLAKHSVGEGVMYSVPLTKTKETKLNVGYSYSGSSVKEGALKDLDLKSTSHDFFFDISRRLIKTDNYKLYGDIGFDLRNTKTKWLGGHELYAYRSRRLKVDLSSIKDDFYGKWFANIGTSIGLNFFNATNRLDWGMEGSTDGVSKYSIPSNRGFVLSGNVARIQVLPEKIGSHFHILPHNSMAILQAKGQYANRRLLASDKMSFGGMSSIRGYQESWYIKDYGTTASLEVRTPVPFMRSMLNAMAKDDRGLARAAIIDDSIRLAGFYDFGWFGDSHGSSDGPDYLMSVGGGVILKMTRYLSANVYLGVPIGHKPQGASGCRVHFIVTSNIL